MELGLKDKVVVVTGGTRGIGLACAKLFVAEGARVGVTSRSQENVDAAIAEMNAAHGHAADLTDANAAAAMVIAMQEALGPIDVLVNCAGAAKGYTPDELTPTAWHDAMNAKFFSYIHAIDPLIKTMGARGTGVIVNVIGDGGRVASPTHLAGGSANAALMLATAGLATAYGPSGVRVVGINPGLTMTQRVSQGMKRSAEHQGITEADALARSQVSLPIGRIAEPEEIANMVVFAASDRASYLTGANITMAGAKFPTVM